MHVGFYLETNGGTPQNTEIYKALNKAVEENDVEEEDNILSLQNSRQKHSGAPLRRKSGTYLQLEKLKLMRKENTQFNKSSIFEEPRAFSTSSNLIKVVRVWGSLYFLKTFLSSR